MHLYLKVKGGIQHNTKLQKSDQGLGFAFDQEWAYKRLKEEIQAQRTGVYHSWLKQDHDV